MLTQELQDTLRRALEAALARRHEYLLLEHLLFAMLDDPRGIECLEAAGADIERLRAELIEYLESQVPSLPKGSDREPQQTMSFQRVLQRAAMHMRSSGRDNIDAGHLLISMFREAESYAVYVLESQNVRRFDLVNYVSHGISKVAGKEDPRVPTGAGDDGEGGGAVDDPLASFCTELVAKAKAGKIDPLIGRSLEIERALQVLCRRRKNNPVFVGDPGVGKTALAEGLALKISEGKVPDILVGAKVYALDMSAVLAGTRYRGDFEERLKALMKALSEEDNAILFIDEIHTVVGAGATSGGTMDASNMLKPALANGELRCIGSTTFTDYKAAFGRDRALARRFQKIDVVEPTAEETYKILRGLKERYEAHHGVKYTNAALQTAADLAARYINDLHLPDKAIDVIDEAGARMRLQPDSKRRKTVRPKDIEEIVARMARIPPKSVSSDDKEKLRTLERDLGLLIFGQDEAVETVASAVKLGRSGLKAPDKPIANLLFAGPTGVGKTELARQLAVVMGVEFLRFDMSEYMEKHAVSRLIGAPPGYVGFDQGGLLTDAIVKNPHSVLVLDEIEKAHPDLFNILLQVMDHATLTDNNGRKADFRNVVIIMTTNAGARELARSGVGFGGAELAGKPKGGNKALERTFSPEFRNRLDKVVMFSSLPPEVVRRVVDKFIHELDGQLADKKVQLEITDAAKDWLAKEGYDSKFGARPMARVIHEHIKKPMADELLFGSLVGGGVALVDVVDGKIVVSSKSEASDE
ncbi:MAG: ATP-dependent Clp protease ATP-binding subunit ClpA [Proteobacteria bacterium]|nr:ATP-dependent Clp protease ATP-binding subunit ClpA [Pseudomonadota bacterium]